MTLYLGEILDGGTHHFSFTTSVNGVPFTLAGSPVLTVYKDANTTGTTTGPSITADFNSKTGLNVVTLVLSDGFYVADTDYHVVITTGTVDGDSVVGHTVATFSISNRALKWNAAWDAEVQSEVADALAVFWTSPATLVDLVWDEVLTGATHNVATSAGRRLRQIEAAFVLHSGTAQAGSINTITLDTGASATDDFYNHARVVITEGTGIEQERIIVDYVGSTRVATTAPPWIVEPVSGSVFEVEPAISHAETDSRTAHVGLAQAGATGSITLASDADSNNDFYDDDVISIDFGLGTGQERIIIAYNGTSKVATIEPDWVVNPDSTSHYIVEEALVVADIIAISHDQTAADTLELFVEAVDQSTGQIDSGSFASGAINAAAIATDAITAAKIAADAIGASELAADAVNEIADGVLDEDYEGTTTLRQFLRIAMAVLAGKLSGAATTTVTIRNEADDGDRVVATVDSDGNRTAVTLTKA